VINALSGYNKIWGNETLKIDRIGRDGIVVRDVRLTLGLQAQHCVIEELAAKGSGAARGVGFFARFLFSEPDIKFGGRPFEEAALPELDPIHKRIRELLSERLRWSDDGVGIKPRVLDLSQDGKAAWIEAYNAIQSQEGEFGEYADVRDVSSKAGENIARVAAILHVLENGNGGKISAENVRRAEAIVRWHLAEYKRFFVGVVLSQEERDAEKLERWLVAYCRKNKCTSVPHRPVDKGPGRGSKDGRKHGTDPERVFQDQLPLPPRGGGCARPGIKIPPARKSPLCEIHITAKEFAT
jgi:putative DNA primase/helicase